MKDQILANLENPGQLERLYRSDKVSFKRAFNALYPQLEDQRLAAFWHERLNFSSDDISWGSRKDLILVGIASLLAGAIAKLPEWLGIDQEFFYSRNVGFIVFPFLAAYFSWKHEVPLKRIIGIACMMLFAVIFINTLPDNPDSDTLQLSCIHVVLFLWSLLGLAFVRPRHNRVAERLRYLTYNGDLAVMLALILISGGIMTVITVNLFQVIGLDIKQIYFDYVVIVGLSAAPMVGTYLIRTNPQLVGKVSPVIARIFSPIVLVMLVIYLVAMAYAGKDPYNDRESLLIFNLLLVGVMAIIFFSIAETAKSAISRAENWVLFLLAVVTVIVNGVAIAAIVFRISEWGMTPNRAAVLGSNVLMLINLLLVTGQLFRVLLRRTSINAVGQAIALYLPVYVVWAAIVAFVFPFLFGFK